MNQQYLCTRPPMKPHEATAKKLMGSPYKERFKEQNLDPFKIFQLFKVPVNEDAQGPLRKELAACTRTDEGHSHSMPQPKPQTWPLCISSITVRTPLYRPSNHRVEVLRLLRQLPDGTIFRRIA